jgi:HAD superfamily hydrolase (TIGR01509 family)
MPTSFLYFDMGNVLLSFSHERMCRQMAEAAGVDAEAVRRALFDEADGRAWQWRFERGDFDADAAYEQFCSAIDRRPERERLQTAACDIFDEIPESVALVRRLAGAGHRLGILSNTNPLDWAHVSARFPFIRECFAVHALSFEARAMKPAAEVFAYACRRAGAPPAEVFFTDDKPENVEGALAAGLDAVLFTSAEALAKDLQRRAVRGA